MFVLCFSLVVLFIFPLCILELVIQARLQTATGHRHKNRWDRIEINIPSVLLIFTPDWASEQCCGVTLFLKWMEDGFLMSCLCFTPWQQSLVLKTLTATCWIVFFPLNSHHLIYRQFLLASYFLTRVRALFTFSPLSLLYRQLISSHLCFSSFLSHTDTHPLTLSSPCEDRLIFWFLTFIRLNQNVIDS